MDFFHIQNPVLIFFVSLILKRHPKLNVVSGWQQVVGNLVKCCRLQTREPAETSSWDVARCDKLSNSLWRIQPNTI